MKARQHQNNQEKNESLNKWCRCPITKKIMRDPVILWGSGITYEKAAIEKWLGKNPTDPTTGQELLSELEKTLVPNRALQGVITSWERKISLYQKALHGMIAFWKEKNARHPQGSQSDKQQNLRSKP